MGILYWIIIGALAGWIAGLIMKGKGSGLLMNIVIGVVGAFIGGWSFSLIGLNSNGLIGSLATAVFGSVILLFIVKKIK